MARPKVKRIGDYEIETISKLKSLGHYREEYSDLIEIYATLLFDFHKARKEYEKEGMQVETLTAAGNPKKSAHLSALENLRKDIITYSDRLLLSPKSFENSDPPKKESMSKLEKFLSENI